MPVQEYVCKRTHVTQRIVSLKETPPKYVKCQHSTRAKGPCGLRAIKQQVYRVSVSGDLPTRGAF